MTEVKCTVDNCHFWESNKCTADKIEVSKNLTPGDNNMEAGRIGQFEENDEDVNERENRMGTLGRDMRDDEFGTLGNRNNENIDNYGGNLENNELGNKNDNEDNAFVTGENDNIGYGMRNNLENDNDNENAFMTRGEDNIGNMGTMTNQEGNEGETIGNREQDLEAGTIDQKDPATSVQTKCVTFRPEE